MAVQDDLRRLSQVDSIYLGYTVVNEIGYPFTSWFKGRLQQANDGNWIVRSVSQDGAIAGFQLGPVLPNWQSYEAPNTGIVVTIPITLQIPGQPGLPGPQGSPFPMTTGTVTLGQQLPPDLTN